MLFAPAGIWGDKSCSTVNHFKRSGAACVYTQPTAGAPNFIDKRKPFVCQFSLLRREKMPGKFKRQTFRNDWIVESVESRGNDFCHEELLGLFELGLQAL